MPSYLKLIAKLLFIAAALFWVFTNIDTERLIASTKGMSLSLLCVAIACIIIAQIISAFRTKYYFDTEGLLLSKRFHIGFYFVGMLYNLILPGGIGGDGYKVYLLNKLSHLKVKRLAQIIISERANGLLVMIMLCFAILPFSAVKQITTLSIPLLMLLGATITIIGYHIGIRYICNEHYKTAFGALKFSLGVQLLGLLMGYALFMGLDNTLNSEQIINYLLLFSIAMIASVIPISIGGIGTRELVMLYLAPLLNIDQEIAIASTIIYFLCNILVSLGGLFDLQKLEKLYHVS